MILSWNFVRRVTMTVIKRLSTTKYCSVAVPPTVIILLSTVLLFVYWNKYDAAAILRLSYPTSSTRNTWIPLENNVTLFSAYYDDRPFRPNPVIVVLGLEKQSRRSTRYRCILYADRKTATLRQSAPLQVLTRVHWLDGTDKNGVKIENHRPFSYTCGLPSAKIPEKVTIIPENESNRFLNSGNKTEKVLDSKNFVAVTNRKQTKRRSFGVCISSPIFKVDNPQQLIDSFEINRMLGAEFVTAYVFRLPGKALKILEKYSQDGFAEVVRSWGSNFPGSAHYYGQLLSITDCLYRNIYRVKYLVYTDLDEIIVPLKHANWSSLMDYVDDAKRGSFNFEMIYLKEVKTSQKQRVHCPSGKKMDLKLSRFATFGNRSNVLRLSSPRTKYIVKTNVTLIAQIHYAEKLMKGYVKYNVPTDTALLYHYRVPYQRSRYIKTWVTETVIVKHLGRLFTAVVRVLCDLS